AAGDGRRAVLRGKRLVDPDRLVILARPLELTRALELCWVILRALGRPGRSIVRARYTRDGREEQRDSADGSLRAHHGRPPVASRMALFFSASRTSRSSSAFSYAVESID